MTKSSGNIEAIKQCQQMLIILKWDWNHARIQQWLKAVAEAHQIPHYSDLSQIPDYVFTSLSKFLDLYHKCNDTLVLLRWDWNHPKVKQVESKYGCINKLPLKGYQELYALLDDAWFFAGGGF